MSMSYKRPNCGPETTGLQEFTEERGAAFQKIDTIRNAHELIVGEASSSIPNATAYEILCGINHIRHAAGKVRTFVFPAAPIQMCTVGTSMRPTIVQNYSNENGRGDGTTITRQSMHEHSGYEPLVIDESQLGKGSVGIGANPTGRVKKMIARAIDKQYQNGQRDKIITSAEALGITDVKDIPAALAELAMTDGRVAELLPEAARGRVETYLLKLPSTAYMTADKVPFVEHMVRQRLRHILELGYLLLEGEDHKKLENFSIESILDHLGEITLGDISAILGPEHSDKIAFTYDCAECGMNTPDKVAHYVHFDGTVLQKNGQPRKKKKNPLAGCKMLGEKAETKLSKELLLQTPIKDLLQAGFMLSGTGIYAAIHKVFDSGDRTLGVANYRPARGTVTALSKMWRGPMYITTRARIFKDGRVASYPELQEYLRTGDKAVGRFMDFAGNIPILAEGPEMKFEIE